MWTDARAGFGRYFSNKYERRVRRPRVEKTEECLVNNKTTFKPSLLKRPVLLEAIRKNIQGTYCNAL